MLVSAIITKGLSYAALPSTNLYSAADQLDSVQQCWYQIYEKLCEKDDDSFLTQSYVTLSSFTPDANRQYMYNYTLPADFYRLRLFQYQPDGQLYYPVQKMTLENFGNIQTTPGYRLTGTTISLFSLQNFTNWCIWYYPVPATLTTGTNLVYPTNVIFELMAWQVAVDALRKQGREYADKQARFSELWNTFEGQLNRDEARAESPKNVFGQGFAPYI